jgi:hypothetical protein
MRKLDIAALERAADGEEAAAPYDPVRSPSSAPARRRQSGNQRQ